MSDAKSKENEQAANEELQDVSRETEQNQQDILEVVRRLESVAGSFNRQQAEFRNVRSVQEDLKNAMATVLRSVESIAAPYQEIRPPDPTPRERPPCDCRTLDPCECVGDHCCCFDFIFRRVRVLAGQVGVDKLLDGETTTGLAGARAGMECQFFVSIDGSGIIVPNQIWGFIQLTKRANRPGIWHDIDRTVNRVCFPCGSRRTFPFTVQVVEREVGTVEAPLGLDEFGNGHSEVTLNCNCDKSGPIYVPITLDGGGAGRGDVECVFEAVRRC